MTDKRRISVVVGMMSVEYDLFLCAKRPFSPKENTLSGCC
jgi:hypothetical protein